MLSSPASRPRWTPCPTTPPRRTSIAVSRGTYRERVTIPASKQHLTLLGATGNPRDVTIAAADYNQEVKPGEPARRTAPRDRPPST